VGYRIVSTFESFFFPPVVLFLGWVCSGYLGLWCDVVWCGGCDYFVFYPCGEVSGRVGLRGRKRYSILLYDSCVMVVVVVAHGR